jgi:hypothetical protein
MKTNCINCGAEIYATEETKRCACGLLYRLSLDFPFDPIFKMIHKKKGGMLKLVY